LSIEAIAIRYNTRGRFEKWRDLLFGPSFFFEKILQMRLLGEHDVSIDVTFVEVYTLTDPAISDPVNETISLS
jgi:hypothetical protein